MNGACSVDLGLVRETLPSHPVTSVMNSTGTVLYKVITAGTMCIGCGKIKDPTTKTAISLKWRNNFK